MILILLSWLYVFFTAATFGIALSKMFRIQRFDLVVTPFLGLFHITILAAVWAFFGPISITFHCILIVLSILFWYNNKTVFGSIWQNALSQIKSYSFPIKILLIASSLLILAQSATLPFIIDNESYYIQTIKWINQYGFVKGLANLHLFLGQASGWHIAQSVYSLSFLYDRFNDLNGFCLLLLNFFAFGTLHSYFSKGNRLDLVFGLLPLGYIFLFQFVSSPSPDLPIYIIAFLLFALYTENTIEAGSFSTMALLALFAFFIKVTAVVLLLLPLILLLRNFKALKRTLYPLVAVASIVLIVFISKNILLTGYPLFPLLCFRIDLDYTVPAIIMDFFFSKSMLHSFYIDNAAFGGLSVIDMMKHYFFNNGICGYIGIISILSLLVAPFVIIKKHLPKSIWGIYFTFLALAVLLCFSSPQYRFYVYFSLFFALLFLSLWIKSPKLIVRLQAAGLILVAIFLFVPISYGTLTSNKLLGQNSTFHLKDILIPEPNSKWSPEFRGGSVGNMRYHSPLDTSFFWVTGNGELPCVNTTQIEYFHKGFSFIPQQRSIDLKDGFYSQKVNNDE